MAPGFKANGESQLVAGKEQWKIEAPPHRWKRFSINNVFIIIAKNISNWFTNHTSPKILHST
jgi:hypothetical protein